MTSAKHTITLILNWGERNKEKDLKKGGCKGEGKKGEKERIKCTNNGQ